MKKIIQKASVFFILIGICGYGGAVDLAQSTKLPITYLIIGIVLALVSFGKGGTHEKDIEHHSYHDASYPSSIRRS